MVYYKAASQYLRAVSRHLACSKENHARLMKLTGRAVNACLDDDSGKSYAALVTAIGKPEAFAESLLAGIPGDEVESSRRKRRFRFWATLISIALVLAAVFTVLTVFYIKYKDDMAGDFIITDTHTLTDEEIEREYQEYLKYKQAEEAKKHEQ